ncbi:MAG TPA: hypothetical protein GXZ48_01410, partial [Acholeplasmataceae bacterium]|nr:hypothetical protein [Acholeplasmataceae bacterium]
NSNYILLHLPEKAKPILLNALFDVLRDYKVIIATIERYKYFSCKDLIDLKNQGALFLVENSSLTKGRGKKLLKKGLVDFIASYDNFKEKLIKPKYISDEYFEKLTIGNYQKIINLDL